MPEFRFHLISLEQMDICDQTEYAFILTRSRLRLFSVIFRKCVTELWPMFDVRISFLLHILRKNWQNFTKFYIYIHIDKIYFGLFVTE